MSPGAIMDARGESPAAGQNNALPTAVDGVSVMVNGIQAYVGYVSPKQLNVLTPVDTPAGAPVSVQVSSNGMTGGSTTVPDMPYSPACFFYKTGPYVAALHSDNVTPVGPTTLFPNSSTPAKPGETVSIYATGFGDTNPQVVNGAVTTGRLPLATTPVVTIGGVTAQIAFSGITSPGVYQFNVTIPSSTPNGDAAVMISVGSFATPAGGLITVQQ